MNRIEFNSPYSPIYNAKEVNITTSMVNDYICRHRKSAAIKIQKFFQKVMARIEKEKKLQKRFLPSYREQEKKKGDEKRERIELAGALYTYFEPSFLKEKIQVAQIIQKLIKASSRKGTWKQFYIEADALWEQSQKAWEERKIATWKVESTKKAFEHAEERLKRANTVFENTDLNKTILGRISSLAGKTSEVLACVPEAHAQIGSRISGTVATTIGVMNYWREHAPIDLAEKAKFLAQNEQTKAEKALIEANNSAPDIRQKAEHAEFKARTQEGCARKETIERLQPPLTTFFDETEWNTWAILLTQAAKKCSLAKMAIPFLTEHGLSDPLWAAENVRFAWMEAEVGEEEFVNGQEIQNNLRITPFKETFQKASTALQKAEEITKEVEKKITEAQALLDNALRNQKHWKNELEEISATLDELEKPKNKRIIGNDDAIEEKQREFGYAFEQFNESCHKFSQIEETLIRAATALETEEGKELIARNQYIAAKKEYLRNQERIEVLQSQLSQSETQGTFRLPQLTQRGEGTLKTQNLIISSLSSLGHQEQKTKKVKPPQVLDRVYEIIGKSHLQIEERQNHLKLILNDLAMTDPPTSEHSSAKGIPLTMKAGIILPEIRVPSEEDLSRWKALEQAKEYIEENHLRIATIKARLPQSMKQPAASLADANVIDSSHQKATAPVRRMGTFENIPEECSDVSDSDYGDVLERDSWNGQDELDSNETTPLTSLGLESLSYKKRKPKSPSKVFSQASSQASSAIGKARSESVVSYIQTGTSLSGSFVGSIPATVRLAATSLENKTMNETLDLTEQQAKKWAERVLLADKKRIAAGGAPFPDEASLFAAWQEADLVAQAAWKKKCHTKKGEDLEAEMAATWEQNTSRWEARAQADALEIAKEEINKDLNHMKAHQTVLNQLDPLWLERKKRVIEDLKQIEKEHQAAQKKWEQIAQLEENIKTAQIPEEKKILLDKLKENDQFILAFFEKMMEGEGLEEVIEIARAKKARLKGEGSDYIDQLNLKKQKNVESYLAAPLEQEQRAKEHYYKEILRDALNCVLEKTPKAEMALKNRVSIAKRAQQRAQEIAKESKNEVILLTASRTKNILDIDEKVLTIFQEEKKRLEKIEFLWKRQIEREKRAPAIKHLTAVREYHIEGRATKWQSLPLEERETYDSVITFVNEITTHADTQKLQEAKEWVEELRLTAGQLQKRVFTLPSTKIRAQEAATKAEIELTNLIAQDTQRISAVNYGSVTYKQRKEIFGKAEWARYFGDIGTEPPLPRDINRILNSPCPIFQGKKVGESHVLVLIPKMIDGEQLTIGTLEKLARAPKGGGKATSLFVFDEYANEYWLRTTDEPHWMLMTKDVIEGSRNRSYAEQQGLVADLAKRTGIGYEVPRLLEAAICILMRYVSTGERLFRSSLFIDSSSTYTSCQDKFGEEQLTVVLGGFSPFSLCTFPFGHGDDDCGVAACFSLRNS